MNLQVRTIKVILSLSLAVTVTTLFTLRAYAMVESVVSAKAATTKAAVATAPVADEFPTGQDCTGTLTVKSGTVLVNGNAAQTGATIMNGSAIASSDGSSARRLEPPGKIDWRFSHHFTSDSS